MIIIDITDLKRQTAELDKSHKRLETLLEGSKKLALVHDKFDALIEAAKIVLKVLPMTVKGQVIVVLSQSYL